jgi:hypothetical protein
LISLHRLLAYCPVRISAHLIRAPAPPTVLRCWLGSVFFRFLVSSKFYCLPASLGLCGLAFFRSMCVDDGSIINKCVMSCLSRAKVAGSAWVRSSVVRQSPCPDRACSSQRHSHGRGLEHYCVSQLDTSSEWLLDPRVEAPSRRGQSTRVIRSVVGYATLSFARGPRSP